MWVEQIVFFLNPRAKLNACHEWVHVASVVQWEGFEPAII